MWTCGANGDKKHPQVSTFWWGSWPEMPLATASLAFYKKCLLVRIENKSIPVKTQF